MHSGSRLLPSFPIAITTAGLDTPGKTIAPWSMASSGICTPGALAGHPERYGPWQTVYDRFNRWRKDGTWAKILDALLFRLDQAGLIDRDLWLVDASVIRASRAAAGAKKKHEPAAHVGRA